MPYLYDVRKNDFDEVAVSAHHFMVVEVAGDRLFFEAITHEQTLLDCGVVYRTPTTKPDKPGSDEQKWLAECESGRPRVITTR